MKRSPLRTRERKKKNIQSYENFSALSLLFIEYDEWTFLLIVFENANLVDLSNLNNRKIHLGKYD